MDTDILLIKQIDDFLKSSGMTATRFGERALRDPNLVFQVRGGRWLRGPTRKRVTDFIESQSQASPEAA